MSDYKTAEKADLIHTITNYGDAAPREGARAKLDGIYLEQAGILFEALGAKIEAHRDALAASSAAADRTARALVKATWTLVGLTALYAGVSGLQLLHEIAPGSLQNLPLGSWVVAGGLLGDVLGAVLLVVQSSSSAGISSNHEAEIAVRSGLRRSTAHPRVRTIGLCFLIGGFGLQLLGTVLPLLSK